MTVKNISASIIKVMDSIQFTDKRQAHKVVYPLIPTLLVICLAYIAGKNNAVAVADYWKYNLERLRSLIPGLPAEPISHDTVLRLMKSIRFDEFNAFILQLTQSIIQATKESEKSIVALDGQTPRAIEYTQQPMQRHPQDRRTYDHLYFVTAYDATHKLVLAQEEELDKENENQACLRLIDMIACADCLFTSDALNSQRTVAAKIIAKGGDYCLAIKDNHKSLRKAMSEAFNNAQLLDENSDYYTTEMPDSEHGRIENRTVIALPAAVLKKQALGAWADDAQTIFLARTCSYDKKYKVYREPQIRYYISSLAFDNEQIAQEGYRAIRGHWGIENSLHYVLDVTFNQDRAQMKNRNYIRNQLLCNKLALNAIKCAQPAYSKGKEVTSIKRLTAIASYSPQEALKILSYYVKEE